MKAGVIERLRETVGVLGLALVLLGCSSPSTTPRRAELKAKPALPPEPVVNHSPPDAPPGQRIAHGELILDVDEAKRQLTRSWDRWYAMGYAGLVIASALIMRLATTGA